MQVSVPEVMDIHRESRQTLAMYGAKPGAASFANNCLLARRLVEQGVRFVQLFDWGWDGHGTGVNDDLVHQLPKKCQEIDRPVAALIADLKQRGLLDDTLVIWGGEFGRTSMMEVSRRLDVPGPRSSSARVHDAVRRRRHEAGADLRRDGRLRLSSSPRTK